MHRCAPDLAVGIGEPGPPRCGRAIDRWNLDDERATRGGAACENVVAAEACVERVVLPEVAEQDEVVRGGLREESEPPVQRDDETRRPRLQDPHHLGLRAMIRPSREEIVVRRRCRMAEREGHERGRWIREDGLVRPEAHAEVAEHPVQCAQLLATRGLDVDGGPAAVEP